MVVAEFIYANKFSKTIFFNRIFSEQPIAYDQTELILFGTELGIGIAQNTNYIYFFNLFVLFFSIKTIMYYRNT